MDGIHDLGGMDGFDDLPPDEPDDASPFHQDWEGRVYALFVTGIASGAFNLDEFRYTLEQHNPEFYLERSYYERWLTGIESLLLDAGVIDRGELADRVTAFECGEAEISDKPGPSLDELTEGVAKVYQSGRVRETPVFEPGDEVEVRNDHPKGHTRCPRYIRGIRGTIHAHRGTHVLPDASAHGEDRAEPLYNVKFDAANVWGANHTDADAVHIELWESYLSKP
ncbi:nitrile hydratase subunit beta [Haladaptatus caseinilyticus]|uniref:nitrile hydratase subunit beta n=1 Tax=Haladaptatus caseinilyticus TaxID=2993314 RepID=UPI00224B005D|nr:nitrile hydratase subunit beta [Haladaptatus caseinilyticus]